MTDSSMLKGKERKMDWNGKWKERIDKMKEKEILEIKKGPGYNRNTAKKDQA